MKSIGRITVKPALPERIERLNTLAHNLYWSWTPKAWELYRALNPELWAKYHNNPVRTLLEVSQADLHKVAQDSEYLELYDRVMQDFDAYVQPEKTWYSEQQQKLSGKVAYFSAEFAFAEALPIYSGGLGVLAGDHCKSASDLGLPFVAVGLLYHQGYFSQLLNKDGWQEERYDQLDLNTLPLQPALTPEGHEVLVSVELPTRAVYAKVWKLNVGRIPVYLLDTNVLQNSPSDQALTARLYGGDQEMRIQQELILGIGGVRALRAVGENIEVWHMNEGHAAFLGLERIRELQQRHKLSFKEAAEVVANSSLFTTHTPVPAGNDAFGMDLIDKYLGDWYNVLASSRDEFIALAGHEQPWGMTFSMTVLALRLSRAANGVSKLHGEVSRKMWNFLYSGAQDSEVPIGHVTNGAHTLTFLAQELREVFDAHLPEDWQERVHEAEVWEHLDNVPDSELAGVLHDLKKKMIAFVRERLRRQYVRNGASAEQVASASSVLGTHTLTIGFARRFATYKRATLLFRDIERLKRIVNNPECPVQFIFAGKAHPADNPGKEFIQQIYHYSQDPDLKGKLVILENYDMEVARYLVQGVDIWLNNPRRPLEASGTSGMKASFNGSPNLSILDGWWEEGYDGSNGWAIGEQREYENLGVQDDADAFSLYDILEQNILPAYYARNDEKVRYQWMSIARRAIKTVAPQFSMARQVIDYTQQYYLPLSRRSAEVNSNHFVVAQHLADWKASTKAHWQQVSLEAFATIPETLSPHETVTVMARVNTAGIEHLLVQAVLYHTRDGEYSYVPLIQQQTHDTWAEYSAAVPLPESGTFELGVRVIPAHPALSHILELGLVKWA